MALVSYRLGLRLELGIALWLLQGGASLGDLSVTYWRNVEHVDVHVLDAVAHFQLVVNIDGFSLWLRFLLSILGDLELWLNVVRVWLCITLLELSETLLLLHACIEAV